MAQTPEVVLTGTHFEVQRTRPYAEAYVGTCTHPDCLEGERSRFRTPKKGSVGQAERAVSDHLRDKHGLARR